MAWALFDSWDDLTFQNYSISEEFEDGTVGAWLLEDWEIYGPGTGGYTSSGPYGNWEDDILAWLQSGSYLAYEIIDWNASQLQSHGISDPTRDVIQDLTGDSSAFVYLDGSFYYGGATYDSTPTFGTGGEYSSGEIVVTAAYGHNDYSTSYHFATYDPYNHDVVTWVENVSFLDQARADADARIILFEVKEGAADIGNADKQVIISAVGDLLSSLKELSPTGYFQVSGYGKVMVSELIALLSRADWQIFPDTYNFGNNGVGASIESVGNVTFQVQRDALLEYSNNPTLLAYYLLHETIHVTRMGDDAWEELGNGAALESLTNSIYREIATQIESAPPDPNIWQPTHGYSSTTVMYTPNLPNS